MKHLPPILSYPALDYPLGNIDTKSIVSLGA